MAMDKTKENGKDMTMYKTKKKDTGTTKGKGMSES